ncbi:hypothetical protein Poly24_11400 [Rosistilla carotiformis]|uniref:Uncharacterized protein n=1 Tax=Rosistilla carotiformis TaxID=2528017 RepID=A0A518JPG0_9BACT|nr:hypothetical protein Poly24_11400 [Rosistilla carotiformis]
MQRRIKPRCKFSTSAPLRCGNATRPPGGDRASPQCSLTAFALRDTPPLSCTPLQKNVGTTIPTGLSQYDPFFWKNRGDRPSISRITNAR